MVLQLEVIFDRGVLSGVKTRWWTNGEIKEEDTGAMEVSGEDFGMIKADCKEEMIKGIRTLFDLYDLIKITQNLNSYNG